MSDERLRLKKLIEHWIEHNDQHNTRFEEASKEAVEMGLEEVAGNLKAAAMKGKEVSGHLRKAIELVE